ncbi:MAG: ABC transporter permease [Chloracidobacterium sp.]
MWFYSVRESIGQAFATIAARKFRSLLTILGVIIGTTSVILVSSVVTGLEASFAAMVERFGTNTVFISKFDFGGPRDPTFEERQRKDLTYEDGLAIAELPSVAAATASLGKWPGGPDPPILKYRDRQANSPVLRGGDPAFLEARNMQMLTGRYYTDVESRHGVPVAVIGYDTAETLFGTTEAVGKELTINGQIFRVVGVLEKSPARGMFPGANWEDNCAIIPHATFRRLYPRNKNYIIVAKAKDGQLDRMVDDITRLLRKRRNVPFYKADDFHLSTPTAEKEGFGKITLVLAAIVVPISGMALLVGGIGVLNIMLVSVTERTKEIGTRRALGARRRDIIMQFLIEAMSLTGLGGCIGIVAGITISALLNATVPVLPSSVSMFWVMVGFVISVSIGLISGLIPAIKAAYLDPAEALRYE